MIVTNEGGGNAFLRGSSAAVMRIPLNKIEEDTMRTPRSPSRAPGSAASEAIAGASTSFKPLGTSLPATSTLSSRMFWDVVTSAGKNEADKVAHEDTHVYMNRELSYHLTNGDIATIEIEPPLPIS